MPEIIMKAITVPKIADTERAVDLKRTGALLLFFNFYFSGFESGI